MYDIRMEEDGVGYLLKHGHAFSVADAVLVTSGNKCYFDPWINHGPWREIPARTFETLTKFGLSH